MVLFKETRDLFNCFRKKSQIKFYYSNIYTLSREKKNLYKVSVTENQFIPKGESAKNFVLTFK